MSDIGSTLRKHWIEVAWALFALANVAVVFRGEGWEAIPFHLIWLSLVLVYWIRMWRFRTAMIVVGVTLAVSELAVLFSAAESGGPGLDELFEAPLIAAMLVAMIMYAERFRAAISNRDRILEQERYFVRNASHELRTPITVARGHAELIRESAPTQQIEEDADVVLDELGRLSRVSERLLLLAATEHPNFLRPEPVDVESLLERMVDRWRVAVPRQWSLRCETSGWVKADRERLELALDSLIENAVQFTSEAETVTLACHSEGDHVVIQVIDSGSGIPADQLERVFEPFARGDAARGRRGGGTGLGLAIVKAVVEAHGGTVSVTSDPGHPTTFSISLPGFTRSTMGSAALQVPPPAQTITT